MAMPEFTMRQLLEAGIHFGHNTQRWNPKMKPFIFGVRNNVHIIDLQQTVPMLDQALKAVRDVAANGGRQYYVNHRWLGGMMTNWKTISNSITRLRDLQKVIEQGDTSGLTKKEQLNAQRDLEKLELTLGGIKDMAGTPDLIFIIDTNKEKIAIQEANNLNIPVVAVIDTNSTPEGVDFPIPGNDDALRAIELYCDLLSSAVLDGMQSQMAKAGIDAGEALEVKEDLPAETVAEDTATETKKAANA